MIEQERQFYMIFSPQGGAPTNKHNTYDEAKKEAARLANQNPSREFYILVAIEKTYINKIISEPLHGVFKPQSF